MNTKTKTTTPMMKGPMPHMPYDVVRSVSEQMKRATENIMDKRKQRDMNMAIDKAGRGRGIGRIK